MVRDMEGVTMIDVCCVCVLYIYMCVCSVATRHTQNEKTAFLLCALEIIIHNFSFS